MKSFALTFDEKTFARDLTGSLEKLLLEGWTGFEFAPDTDLLPATTYKQLISALSNTKGQLSFHVPNFIVGKNFNPAAFSTSLQLIRNFTTFFELCGDLASYHQEISPVNPVPVILHGAEYERPDEELEMKEQTLKFLDWGTNYCAKRNLPLLLCLENAFSPNHLTTADGFQDVKDILGRLNGYPLGFCADLPHLAGASNTSLSQLCSTNLNQNDPIEPWLKKHLKHVHLHGYQHSPYKSHLPLHSAPSAQNPSVFKADLQLLKSIEYHGLIVDEVLGLEEGSAFEIISKDLSYLNTLED